MNKHARILLWCLALLAAVAAPGLAPGAAPAAERGKFYVIGTGPAGPQTATLQALDTIRKMDAILAPKRQARQFSEYIGDIPVIMDPWQGRWDYKGKPLAKLSKEEMTDFRVERFKGRDRNVARIKELMAQGKNVALLDSGNPCLFGPSHWYTESFAPEELVIIPGMGCDAAGMAALKRSTIPAHTARFVVQTAPFFLMDRGSDLFMGFDPDGDRGKEALADLAKHDHTMVIYMGLKDPVKLFQALGRYLPADLPVACVFWAGYPDKERVTLGTVGDMGARLAEDQERFMGLLFLGRFLEGKPYQEAMLWHQGQAKK